MVRAQLNRGPVAIAVAASVLCALVATVLLLAPPAGAADADKLEQQLTGAREEAGAISSQLQQSRARLAAAEGEAAVAAEREAEVSGLLSEGEERTAELSRRLTDTRERLRDERARLQRSRAVLAERLVAIYEAGSPDSVGLLLESGDYDDLVARTGYLRAITESDSALADRVAAIRDAVEVEVGKVDVLHEEAVAHEEELAAARDEIAEVAATAEAAAAEMQSLSAEREASLADLRASIDDWVGEVEEARAAEARAATEAEAEEEVGRWLGGPYSIPTYIVMCESGGDYSALNPSSGAGGAYQVLPSTWELYGGKGEPQNAPKAEQDRIAAEIWADSGGGAWVCA